MSAHEKRRQVEHLIAEAVVALAVGAKLEGQPHLEVPREHRIKRVRTSKKNLFHLFALTPYILCLSRAASRVAKLKLGKPSLRRAMGTLIL